jgi:hypothetical protein
MSNIAGSLGTTLAKLSMLNPNIPDVNSIEPGDHLVTCAENGWFTETHLDLENIVALAAAIYC